MEPSLAGALVCAALLLFGWVLGSPIVLGLFASLPFGSTAIVKLSSLGGSSPLVFTVFVAALLTKMALAKGFLDDLAVVLRSSRTSQIVLALALFAIASAYLMPRLFAGQTSALVVVEGQVVEVPLAPSGGNITQTAYFVLGALVYLAFCILLQRKNAWEVVQRGFFVFASVHAALGLVDIASKVAGIGDVLEPIRSAGYALLVDVIEGGFWRIVGGYPEASTFAAYTLPCLAFTFTYWRTTRSRYALGLSLVLLLLLIFSTSTTAYAGFAVVLLLYGCSVFLNSVRRGIGFTDLAVFGGLWLAAAAALAAYLYNDQIFTPITNLLDSVLFNKQASFSGQERAYWNARGIDAFFDSMGLGIGMGSSRSSSWVISVMSQLGIVGVLLFGLLLLDTLRGLGRGSGSPMAPGILPLFLSARAAVLAWVAAISISFGSADPGLIFFIGLAVLVSARVTLRASLETAHAQPSEEEAAWPEGNGGGASVAPTRT